MEDVRELWFYLHTYQTSRRIERTLSLHTHPPTFKEYMKEMWVYLERTYITTFRGEWESVPCYLSSGGYERTVSLPIFLPAFKGDVREPCLYLPIFGGIQKNCESIYQTTYQPSRGMWENCESHTYLSTFHGDVRKLWVYLPTYQPSRGMWENCLLTCLPTYLHSSLTSPSKVGRLRSLTCSFGGCERPECLPTYLPLSGKWKNWDSIYLPTYLPSGYVRELSLPTHIPIFLQGECERTLSLPTYLPTFTVNSHTPWSLEGRSVDSVLSHPPQRLVGK